MGEFAAQQFAVAVQRVQHGLQVAAAERHDIDGRKLEIRAHADVGDGDDLRLQHGIAERPAGQKVGERVTNEFGHAQHALRRLRAVLMMGSGHVGLRSSTATRLGAGSLWSGSHMGREAAGPVIGRGRRPPERAAAISSGLQAPLDLLHGVALDDIAGAHVLVVLERHAAFLAGHDVLHLVLVALQRRELALVHHHVVADEAHVGAALDGAVRDAATRDLADLRDVEHFEDLGIAEHVFAQSRREKARHRRLHVVHQIVDDVVIADLGARLLGEAAGFLVRADVEADDDGLGGFG